MIRLRHKLLIEFFRLFDLGLFAATLFCVVAFIFEQGDLARITNVFRLAYHPIDGLGIVVLIAGWALILGTFVRYDANRFVDLTPQIIGVLKATTGAALLVAIIGQTFDIGRFDRTVVLFFWVITSLLGIMSRLVIHGLLRTLRRSGRNFRHLLIIGDAQQAGELAERIDRKPELGYKTEGLLLTHPISENGNSQSSRWAVLGTSSDLKAILKQGVVDEVIITASTPSDLAAAFDAVRLGQQLGVVIRLLPEESDVSLLGKAQLEVFEGQYVVTFFREVLIWHLLAKRLLDILVSSVLLVVLIPLFVIVIALIKFTSPGPIIFSQERIGMNRRRFRMYKFRSMYQDAERRKQELAHLNEQNGPIFKIRNDPRITPLGKFLRGSSIDELPQLWNVLKGEMSLVGPRPPIPSEVDKYEWLDRRRLSIRPGITCLWQIGGRSNLSFDRWMELDREYIENWSFWLDLRILFMTIPAVLFRRGAA